MPADRNVAELLKLLAVRRKYDSKGCRLEESFTKGAVHGLPRRQPSFHGAKGFTKRDVSKYGGFTCEGLEQRWCRLSGADLQHVISDEKAKIREASSQKTVGSKNGVKRLCEGGPNSRLKASGRFPSNQKIEEDEAHAVAPLLDREAVPDVQFVCLRRFIVIQVEHCPIRIARVPGASGSFKEHGVFARVAIEQHATIAGLVGRTIAVKPDAVDHLSNISVGECADNLMTGVLRFANHSRSPNVKFKPHGYMIASGRLARSRPYGRTPSRSACLSLETHGTRVTRE
ncbi:hypothetical protein CXG81DRAFT_19844 [Caulochytrium protostelioides]|uniref:SET domain-containing protein n=1 Tax=Caulochytrium protostelioides TaxID=1555241 RepID=A0A4V1IUD2_9FUNG|nr:hypothetical protein CXG81DRAFT_19844 [Caulochytrium protostelioides]|eukprot:RKP00149.1 hypothetical protein CXG81DRAFT_19844 [Caulochytrium protostelioides]